ncbi:hypothetical protein ACOSP7_025896 [Xanthoceras sorbifolium]
MKRAVLRNHLLYARSFLQSPSKFNSNNPNLLSVRLASLTRHRLRFYSSEYDSSNSARSQNNIGSVDFEDVSNEELKRRIDKYLVEGDEEAIPSIFEAILSRKLSGKHEDSDDELMEEFRHKISNGATHQEVDSEED